MKPFRVPVLAASALAVLCAAQVSAQSVPDPAIRIGGGKGSVPITSPIFGVLTPSGNSPALSSVPGSTDCVLLQLGKPPAAVPQCYFQNKIKALGGAGFTITRLTFVVDNADAPGVLTCGLDTVLGGIGPFASCSVQPVGDGSFSLITFFNGSIPPGGDFSMGMRGFTSNTGFAGVALRDKNSDTSTIYELPDLARPNTALPRPVNGAPRFRCETCQLRTGSYLERDRGAFGSRSIKADGVREFQGSAGSWSHRPDLDAMSRPPRVTFEEWPTSDCEWRIT